MSGATNCIRCQGPMEAGYIVDASHTAILPQRWYPGEPKEGWLSGLKVDRNQAVETRTFRCKNCGYLESYAIGG